jgi:hypothetical protein
MSSLVTREFNRYRTLMLYLGYCTMGVAFSTIDTLHSYFTLQ